MATIYRYTSKGDSLLWLGRIELPHSLTKIIDDADNWLPHIERRDVVVYFTYQGKQKFDRMLMPHYKRFISHIELDTYDTKKLGEIVYQDEFVVVCKK